MKRRLKLNAAYMDIDKSVVMQTTFNIRQDIMGNILASPLQKIVLSVVVLSLNHLKVK